MTDVFQESNGSPANFTDGRVEVKVNGTTKTRVTIQSGETLGAFLTRQAQTYGVRTYSAYADGRKLDTTEAAQPMTPTIRVIELVAKDARG